MTRMSLYRCRAAAVVIVLLGAVAGLPACGGDDSQSQSCLDRGDYGCLIADMEAVYEAEKDEVSQRERQLAAGSVALAEAVAGRHDAAIERVTGLRGDLRVVALDRIAPLAAADGDWETVRSARNLLPDNSEFPGHDSRHLIRPLSEWWMDASLSDYVRHALEDPDAAAAGIRDDWDSQNADTLAELVVNALLDIEGSESAATFIVAHGFRPQAGSGGPGTDRGPLHWLVGDPRLVRDAEAQRIIGIGYLVDAERIEHGARAFGKQRLQDAFALYAAADQMDAIDETLEAIPEDAEGVRDYGARVKATATAHHHGVERAMDVLEQLDDPVTALRATADVAAYAAPGSDAAQALVDLASGRSQEAEGLDDPTQEAGAAQARLLLYHGGPDDLEGFGVEPADLGAELLLDAAIQHAAHRDTIGAEQLITEAEAVGVPASELAEVQLGLARFMVGQTEERVRLSSQSIAEALLGQAISGHRPDLGLPVFGGSDELGVLKDLVAHLGDEDSVFVRSFLYRLASPEGYRYGAQQEVMQDFVEEHLEANPGLRYRGLGAAFAVDGDGRDAEVARINEMGHSRMVNVLSGALAHGAIRAGDAGRLWDSADEISVLSSRFALMTTVIMAHDKEVGRDAD